MCKVLLDQIKLNDKTYNEIFQKALSTIPILSNEWTDHNYSDPGITTLQVLSIIKLFQQSYVDRINDKIRYNLIKLLGYDIAGVQPSITYVKVKSNKNVSLPCSQKMLAGNIVFETQNSENVLGLDISKIVLYNSSENKFFDATNLIYDDAKMAVYVFGESANENSAVYLFFDEPIPENKKYSFYVEVEQLIHKKRNYIPDDVDFKLAEICWQIFTKDGWCTLDVNDGTKGFLQNGLISFGINCKMVKQILNNICSGYVIRAVLKKSYYELPPKIQKVNLNVCLVAQQDTQAKSFVFESDGQDEQTYIINNFITSYNNVIVLAKDDESKYFKCVYGLDFKIQKLCEICNNHDGKLKIIFNKKKYGFVPGEGNCAVKVICYSDYFMNQNINNKIFGFENQIIQLNNNMKFIMADKFDFMVKISDNKNGEKFYNINEVIDNKPILEYQLNIENNQLEILSINMPGDISLVITDCVLSLGKGGDVRKNEINKIVNIGSFNKNINQHEANSIDNKNLKYEIDVKNLYQSTGGKNSETIDDVILKIMNDINSTHSLVTKRDFENRILQVPGLNIHKVKAINEVGSNRVAIIVKPNSSKPFPVVSDLYVNAITEYLNKYRLITTQIDILSPVYVPVDVSGVIYVKPNYKNAGKIIKDLIADELSSIDNDKDFGCEIVYGDLYSKIESLECVDVIYSFFLDVVSPYANKLANSNIRLKKNALSYLKNYNVEVNDNIVVI